jgi:hypothetical protein
MAASERLRRRGAIAIAAGAAASLAACDALLGLGDYSKVDCAFNCDASGVVLTEAGRDVMPEAALDASDASDASDADAAEVALTDADAASGPTLTQRWAHWPMPNPDAAIAPDSAVRLPNTMSYGVTDAGYILDKVTSLQWTSIQPANVALTAAEQCANVPGSGWRLPTRIELVSLIDFTQPGLIDLGVFGPAPPGFGVVPTSSPAGDAGRVWYVSFGDGFVDQAPPGLGSSLLCVRGGM